MAQSSLSAREIQVANLLLQGKSNKEIALQLGISVRTVEFHVTHILEKLEVSSRAEAIVKLSNLRESTGDPEVDLRVTPVENLSTPVQNEDKPILNRSTSMKRWGVKVILGLVVLCVLLCVFVMVWNYAPPR